MKHKISICLAAAVLGALLSSPAAAETARTRVVQAVGADALPPYEIATMLRSLGLNPLGRVTRRGPYYVLHALDRHGIEMRVVADAQFGDIVSVTPARQPVNYEPLRYDSSPRVLTVPQNYDRAAPDDDPVPPGYDRVPRGYERLPPDAATMPQGHDRRVSAPPPPRAMLTPPANRSNGPTPIKPLPRPRAADKFLPQPEPQASTDEPTQQSTASVPSRIPPSVTLAPPPAESSPPPANNLIEFPPAAPLE